MLGRPKTARVVTLLVAPALLTLACGKKDPAADNAAQAMGSEGPPNCQRFARAYSACIAEMPEAGRANAQDGLKQMQDAWKKVDKDPMDTLCKQALDAARQGVGPVCPGVKWD